MPKRLELKGKRFGRLRVLKRAENSDGGQTRWLCRCDCGNEVTVMGHNLAAGNTKSCGCLQRDMVAKSSARRYITLNGKTQTLAQWSRETGISYGCLSGRLNRGWSAKDALTTPVWGNS